MEKALSTPANSINSLAIVDLLMRVLFDYQAFELQHFGGISRSYAELISHLQEDGVYCKVGLKESDNAYFEQPGLKPLHYTHNKYFGGKKWFKGQRTLTRKIMRAAGHRNDCLNINREYCIKLLKQQQFDVFEPTFFSPYFLDHLRTKPFVMTVHDMIPELFPKYFPKDDSQIVNKKLLCPLAAAIHVPSHQTKEDLIKILNINPEKIYVIPHGVPQIAIHKTETPRPIGNPYLLFVGERGGYKNFVAFLHEMAILIQTVPGLNLICTGRPFEEQEKILMADLGLINHVHHRFVTDEYLYSLYHHAVAFVYPSAYEGFGIPILEAFVNSCPVLLNNASCFPEIGGEAAIYFNINRKGDLAEHIMELLHYSKEDRQQIINKGLQRANCFSWEKSARKLLHVYDTII